ncbi:hypothetical protein TRIUR3_19997 [Triticum urartu]|uniref:Uncharacterized protein n=1 Tax=Triticum urartu TaxID=4572 RepID=M7ZW43_TRIUA|nr:hypothetical protein TRIUR3_19997 [Triticum urartu]
MDTAAAAIQGEHVGVGEMSGVNISGTWRTLVPLASWHSETKTARGLGVVVVQLYTPQEGELGQEASMVARAEVDDEVAVPQLKTNGDNAGNRGGQRARWC